MLESQLKNLIVKRLSGVFEKDLTAKDFEITRTAWVGNENFFGTYSSASTKTRPKRWEAMAKSVFASRWYLCGEQTDSQYRGTVHGAYFSSLDEAKKHHKSWLCRFLSQIWSEVFYVEVIVTISRWISTVVI